MSKFYTFMDRINDDDVFDSELIKVLLGTQDYTTRMLTLFMPWLIMFTSL